MNLKPITLAAFALLSFAARAENELNATEGQKVEAKVEAPAESLLVRSNDKGQVEVFKSDKVISLDEKGVAAIAVEANKVDGKNISFSDKQELNDAKSEDSCLVWGGGYYSYGYYSYQPPYSYGGWNYYAYYPRYYYAPTVRYWYNYPRAGYWHGHYHGGYWRGGWHGHYHYPRWYRHGHRRW